MNFVGCYNYFNLHNSMEEEEMLYIGIDLGTSAVKLLLMDGEGKIQNIVTKEYELFFPHPGWSEQKPEDWVRAVKEGIRELTEGFDRSQVAGIGAGGQMHGLVALDDSDRVLRPAILWNDGRTQAETDWLNQEIGKARARNGAHHGEERCLPGLRLRGR